MANREALARLKKEIVDILTRAYRSVASGVNYVYTCAKTWITERQAGEAIRRTRQRVMTRLRSIPWLEFARRYRWRVGLGVLLILCAIAIWKVPQWYTLPNGS